MEIINLYKCECCNFTTKNFELAEKHEAAHYGLTVKEKHTYDALKSSVFYANMLISGKSSFNVDKDNAERYHNETERKLINFERNHGLIGGKAKYPVVTIPTAGHNLI